MCTVHKKSTSFFDFTSQGHLFKIIAQYTQKILFSHYVGLIQKSLSFHFLAQFQLKVGQLLTYELFHVNQKLCNYRVFVF